MFDIGFSELVLVFVVGLVVLGPQRLPIAVKTVVGWIRAVRSLAANVQHELTQELKLQELQDSLKKVEQAGKGTLSPELKESIEELRKSAESVKQSFREMAEHESATDLAQSSPPTTATEQDLRAGGQPLPQSVPHHQDDTRGPGSSSESPMTPTTSEQEQVDVKSAVPAKKIAVTTVNEEK